MLTVAHEDYPVLAQRAGGASYRDLARTFGFSHETARAVVAEEHAELIADVRANLEVGRQPVFVVHFGWPQERWQLALRLFEHVVRELRCSGVPVRVQTAPSRDAVVFELIQEEE